MTFVTLFFYHLLLFPGFLILQFSIVKRTSGYGREDQKEFSELVQGQCEWFGEIKTLHQPGIGR